MLGLESVPDLLGAVDHSLSNEGARCLLPVARCLDVTIK